MYAYLKGTVEEISEDALVLEVNQIGYNIKVSGRTANLIDGVGSFVKMYTYTLVREDAFNLYGFLTKDELEIFKKLITVNGIGPKGGLAILSVMGADELRFSILKGDARAIARAPGIGAKTAERVILDLKDKVSPGENAGDGYEPEAALSAGRGLGDEKDEALQALMALGYSANEALSAVKRTRTPEGAGTEAVLREALKFLY